MDADTFRKMILLALIVFGMLLMGSGIVLL
jgi:hypothetical protein